MFGLKSPSYVKPLERRYVLAFAILVPAFNLWFTVAVLDEGAFWRAAPTVLDGYLWLARYWLTIALAVWMNLWFFGLIFNRTTGWRSLLAITAIGVLPSTVLAFAIR